MATITFPVSHSTGSYVQGKIEWEATTNNEKNRSTITADIYARKGNHDQTLTVATAGDWKFRINIGGNAVNGIFYASVLEGWVKLGTHTVTVNHEEDGTKELEIAGYVQAPDGTSFDGYRSTGRKTVQMTPVPRASTITSASDVTLGSKCSVKWTPNSKSFQFKLRFSLGDWIIHTTGFIKPARTTAYTYTGYTIPLEDVAQRIPNDRTANVTVTLYTYNASGVRIGESDSETVTVTVPANESTMPDAKMSLAPEPFLTGTVFEGLYIQGKSKVKASFTEESAKLGASIAGHTLTVNGAIDNRSGYLTSTGTVRVTGIVTDSRGISRAITQNITVVSYQEPYLAPVSGRSKVICQRCDSAGTLSSTGEYIRIEAKRMYSPVTVDDAAKNSCGIQYRYREERGGWPEDWTVIPEESFTNGDEAKLTVGDITFSLDKVYQIQIRAVDELGESTPLTYGIPSGSADFHLRDGGKGAAFGEYATEENVFAVAGGWTAKFKGETLGRVYGLGKAETIQPPADFNDYLEPGRYAVEMNDDVDGTSVDQITNCPSKRAGVLIVETGTGRKTDDGTENRYRLQTYKDGRLCEFKRWITMPKNGGTVTYGDWIGGGWIDLGLAEGVSLSESEYGRNGPGCYYRVEDGNHVYVAFNVALTWSSNKVISNSRIPSTYRPKYRVFAMCAVNGTAVIARCYISTDGQVVINDVQNLLTTANTASYDVNWIDGYIDYFVD